MMRSAAFRAASWLKPASGAPSTAFAAVRAASTETDKLQLTALNSLHRDMGGKMVPFAGYELPVQYKGLGVLKEHNHTRSEGCASIFDVSHMGQLRFVGKDCAKFLESVMVGDFQSLPEGHSKLSLITNANGGIMDDCVVSNSGNNAYGVVVNGACKYTDVAHLQEQIADFEGDAAFELFDEQQLIALQGPGAAAALQGLVEEDLSKMLFMTGKPMNIKGIKAHVTRCGYTGEDGFEVSVAWDKAETLARMLLEIEGVQTAGLGARDSLRLEAGLCLYGHDLDETTTPNEGVLLWTIPKERRVPGAFVGSDVVAQQVKDKIQRKRVGLVVEGAPAREGCKIFAKDGETEVGVITSGTMSPTLKKAIAMGYVARGHFKLGNSLKVQVRNKMQSAVVTKMPFVEPNYYKPS